MFLGRTDTQGAVSFTDPALTTAERSGDDIFYGDFGSNISPAARATTYFWILWRRHSRRRNRHDTLNGGSGNDWLGYTAPWL